MSRIQFNPIPILVAHPQALVRAALTAVIHEHSDLRVAAEARNFDEVDRALAEGQASVALIALTLAGPAPYRKLSALHQQRSQVRIVALSQDESIEQQAAAIAAGARGLVGLGTPGRNLCDALRSVGCGLRWLEASLERYLNRRDPQPIHGPDFEALTPRERQVAALIARGETYQRIAAELRISTHTVKNHVRHIFDKLDVNSRVELVVLALGPAD